jgi:hypothetical protein
MATRFQPQSLAAFASIIVFLHWVAASPLPAQTKSPENTVIRGTVINSKTHEPIGRALVYSPDNRFATMTDDRGRFQFTLPQTESKAPSEGFGRNFAGNYPYALMARKPGFLPANNEQQILQAGVDLAELTLSLVPEALIGGRVQMPGADGFERIGVGLYRRVVREGAEHWDSLGFATSRSDGEFRFAELQPGSYKLVTQELLDRDPLNPRGPLFGYAPVYYPSATDFSAASIIQLTAGTTFIANISLARREYYPVKIKVANASAELPIGIQVWPQGHPGPGFALGYNSTEQTIQGSLPDGSYVVQVSSYGPNAMNGSVNLLVKGAAVEGQSVSLFPNISIPVNIRQEFQRKETLEQLAATRNASPANGWLRSVNVSLLPIEDYGARGSASMRQPQNPEDDVPPRIENVPPGRYKVLVNTALGFAAEIMSGGSDLLNQPLVVSAGGAVSPIEITLRDDGAEIDGVIEGASAATAKQLQGQVYFVPSGEGGGQFHATWIMPDGRFEMRQLPPGIYRVMAFPRSQDLEYTSAEAMRKYESKSQVIRVEQGQKEHLRLSLIIAED